MAYLSKIVRYRAYHYIRKRQPKTVPLDQANYTQAEPDNMSLDKWDIVREAIRLLNPKERQLIDLFYFSGYKDKDILDLHLMDYSSVDSIKSQRYKCIQKLIKLTGELQTKTWSMLVFGQSLTLFI